MLLNKKYWADLLLIAVIILSSCNEKKVNPPEPKIDISTREAALKEARILLGTDARIAFAGSFDKDTVREFIAGTEINKPDKWGIEFHLMKEDSGTFKKVYSTGLLEGSFTGAHVSKEKLQPNYDMVYYNSQDYYIGSGGGEIFAYLVDFNNRETYFAHLFMERGRSISLFLSNNVTPETKDFFLNVFKKDYSNLKIVSKDVELDE